MASTERSPDVSSLPEAEAKEKADMVERSPPTLVPEGGETAPARDSNNDTGAESPARTASPAAATDGSDRRGREHHDATKITASEDEGSPSERSVVTASSDWDTIGTQRGRVRRRERPRDYSVMSDPRYARDAREGWGHIPQEQRGGAIRGLSEPLAAYIKRTWLCEVGRGSMQDWRKRKWNALEWPRPIIDAFYLNTPQALTKSLEDAEYTPEVLTRPSHVPKALGELRNIQRICIMSEYIQQELMNFSSVPVDFGRDTVNISPPYKILIHSFNDLAARLSELEAELLPMKEERPGNEDAALQTPFQTKPGSSNERNNGDAWAPAPKTKSSAQGRSRSKEEPATITGDQQEAREIVKIRRDHLRILVNFVNDELGEVLELRRKIADGTLTSIHFEDLWHLFEPGETVYRRAEDGSEQLFNVYFVSGGQSLKRPPTSAEISEINILRDKMRYFKPPTDIQDKEVEDLVEELLREEGSSIGTWTPFKIDSYCMLSDGERCGPAEVCHRIWPFEGQRDITSLKIFPLRFHPGKDKLLEAMTKRGRDYLFNEGHKSYEGKTCLVRQADVSQVEIKGDVYVDANAYYHDFPQAKPRLGRILRSKQNYAEVEEQFTGGDGTGRDTKGYFANNAHNPFSPHSEQYLRLSGHGLDARLSDEYLTLNSLKLEPFTPDESEIDENLLCLMPHSCHGYGFQLRKWFPLHLDQINDIDRESEKARREGFDDLVIPKNYRDLLVALVDSHGTSIQRRQGTSKTTTKAPLLTQIDLVRGKGQGLIILLHGPPGSGKTSTAETIAAYTRRPLYSITCGDIGTDPMVVETRLLDHMRRADKWGCVLLLDEADVFLVQRDWYNLQRNALTSIFLRQLEYYAGILFLTTNRPGVIDEAFKSRVHISLRYPGIGLDSTKKQWTNILNRLEADNAASDVKIVFDRDALLEFAERHFEKCDRQGVTWNGRQIRNAFQTAIALGHYERISKIREAGMTPEEALKTGKKKWRTVKLTKANFANIAKTAREFEQYIETLRGSDSQNARESELRYDEFDPERPRARKQYPEMGNVRDGISELRDNMRGKMGGGKGKPKKSGRAEPPPPVADDEEEEEEEEDDSDDDDEDEDNIDDF